MILKIIADLRPSNGYQISINKNMNLKYTMFVIKYLKKCLGIFIIILVFKFYLLPIEIYFSSKIIYINIYIYTHTLFFCSLSVKCNIFRFKKKKK